MVCIHRCDVAVLKVMILLDVLLTGPSDSVATSLQFVTYHQDCRISVAQIDYNYHTAAVPRYLTHKKTRIIVSLSPLVSFIFCCSKSLACK